MAEFPPGTNVSYRVNGNPTNEFTIYGMVTGPANDDDFPPGTIEVEWNVNGGPMIACAMASDLTVELPPR